MDYWYRHRRTGAKRRSGCADVKNVAGDRRIRIHTLCLPVTKDLATIFNNFDVKCAVSLLSKMGELFYPFLAYPTVFFFFLLAASVFIPQYLCQILISLMRHGYLHSHYLPFNTNLFQLRSGVRVALVFETVVKQCWMLQLTHSVLLIQL